MDHDAGDLEKAERLEARLELLRQSGYERSADLCVRFMS
jgi:hypothetical protein